MVYDKLSFSFKKIDMTPSEETMLSYPDETKYLKGKFRIDITVQLNSKDIKWSHVDPYSLFIKSIDDTPNWDGSQSAYSSFLPFSCSCGDSGCAGIWDGIHVKSRKRTVEWRAKKSNGYSFLDKPFYSFERAEYLLALKELYKSIEVITKEYGDSFILDAGYSENSMTSGSEFLEYINEVVKPENQFWK